jgi:hypothetical protein
MNPPNENPSPADIEAALLKARLPDGVHLEHHPNGQVAVEKIMHNGKIMHIKRWHDNGIMEEERPYKDGKTHGTLKYWDRTGKLLGECVWNMGFGVQRKWNEEGTLIMENEFLPNGLMRTTFFTFKKPRFVFLRNGKPITKREFLELGGVLPEA